ncbi:MAG: TlpA disulfide reductase family protein [Solirubrobacteraceae bacterium]
MIDDNVTARLAKLKGVPVVLNMWASWCPNCGAELGYFQSLSKAYDGKVAFLGLDSNDSRR